MKKNIFIISIILGLYAFIALATSKNVEDRPENVCVNFASKNLFEDSFGKAQMFKFLSQGNGINGSVICYKIYDTTKCLKAANYICGRLSDSCNFTNTSLVFFDSSWNSNYDSLLGVPGRKILTFKCP